MRNPQSLPSRPWLSEGPLRLNTLLWPSGASRWGVFHALVDDAAMDRIRGATGSFGQPLVIDDGVGPALSVTMYPLPPRPLSQDAAAKGFQLLTLLDRRAYWRWLAADIDVVGGVTSWAGLFGAIAAALGVALAVDDVPAAYLTPPAALSGAYDSLPALLDAACLSCGLRFAAALDGASYRCWSVAAAQTQVARNLAAVPNPRVAGGLFLQGTDLNGVLPAAVRVVFPRADGGIPSTVPSVGLVTLASLNLPSNPPGGPPIGGVGGLTKTFHSSAVATFASGSATNAAALADLATQAATDFYTWQATGVYDLAYAGVAPWLPTGADGLCEYAHGPDRGAGGGILSRFRRDAYFDGQEALWHHTVTPCAAIPTRVRVTGTTPTDTCLYSAELVVRSGCADVVVSPPVAVWLRPDGGTAPAAGDVRMASPEGVRAADGLPVYVAEARPAGTGGGGVGGHITTNTTTTVDDSVTWNVTGGSPTTSVFDVTNLTWKFDTTSTVVFNTPTVNLTANQTWLVSTSTTWLITGSSSTTSIVDLTNLTWKFDTTSTVVFGGPTVNLTASQTWLVSTSTTWLITGGSPTTSVVNLTNVTWKFDTTSTFVLHGPTVSLDLNQTWTVSAGTTWLITGGHPTTSVINMTNVSVTFDDSTTLNFAGPSWDVTANLFTTIAPGVAWNITGGELDLTAMILGMGTGLTWGITDDVTTTIGAGKAWTVTGGKVDFTGSKVTGAGGLISSSATHLTGTTGDAYATMADLVDGQGVHGSFAVKNTDAANSLDVRVTLTDMFGNAAVASSGTVAPGNRSNYVIDVLLSNAPPVKEVLVELRSASPGSPATYEAYISVTAAASLSVGNGGTGADLSATGGPGMIASQPAAGGPLAVTPLDMGAFPRLAAQAMAVNSFR